MCEIGKKMFLRRKELGLTLEDVGNAVGVGKSTVRRWENGMIKNMGRDKISKLAKILKMDAVEFVPGDEQKSKHHDQYTGSDDIEMLEALHQNPKLRLLFDKQKTLTDSDLDAVLGVVNAITKERDPDA